MRVGTLTFHNTINYGAQLQAFALQHVIRKAGYEAEVIDYRNRAVSSRETPAIPSIIQFAKHPRSSLKKVSTYHDIQKRKKEFERFADSSMDIGPCLVTAEDIASRYDTIIVGSDQVWNPLCTGGDMMYFLAAESLGLAKKIAYAASFGSDSFPDVYRRECGEAIKQFNAISVRENAGEQIVRDIASREALLVADPTLLLTGDEWRRIAAPVKHTAPYLFAYMVGERKNTLEYAREVSRNNNLDLIAIDCYYRGRRLPEGEFWNSASIEEFLGLIAGAELVVTSSFHGLALSLAMEANVCYALNPGIFNRNSRLETLATMFGIENRNIAAKPSDDRIDYHIVDNRLKAERDRSLEFLFGALES